MLGSEFQVDRMELRVPVPGFGHQGLHQDIDSPHKPEIWRRLRMAWGTQRIHSRNRYLPVHPPLSPRRTTRRNPNRHATTSRRVRLVAAPGAIVVKSAHVRHSGTFNASTEPRISIGVDYRTASPDS